MTVTVANAPIPTQGRPAAASTFSIRDIVVIAAYHWRLVVSVLLLAAAAGAAGWVMSPVLYTAKAQVLILPGRDATGAAGLLGGAGLLPVDAARATQAEVELLRDRGVVRTMVERVDPEMLYPQVGKARLFGLLPPYPEEQRQEITIDVVLKSLTTAAETTSNLVTISFEHPSRDVAIAAVNALIDAYLEKRTEVYRTLRSPFLRARATTYLDQLRGVEAEIRAKKAEYRILSFEQDVLLAIRTYDSAVQRRQAMLERRESTLGQVQSTERRIRELPGSVFDYREKTDKVDNDETENVLTKLRLERDTLRLRYQDGEPRLEEVNRQIQVLEDIKRQPRRDSSTAREVRNPTIDVMTNNLYQRRIEADAASRSVAELDRQVEEAQVRIDQLRAAEGVFQTLERSRAILEQLYKEASQRTEVALFEEASAGSRTANIRVVGGADASLRGRSNGPSIAAAAMIGGMLLAGVLTVLASWNRRIFLLPDEVTRQLGLPVLASFAEDDGFNTPDGRAQITYLASQLALNQSRAVGGTAIQVVSYSRTERRSAFVGALAFELAEGQNKRVVILDLIGDGDHHWKRFKGKDPVPVRNTGIMTAQTSVPRLQVTVGATKGPVDWQRIDSLTLREVLGSLRSEYEMIVIDSPPARQNLVTLRLAKAVEGSILVVRAEHTRTPVAARLRDQLLEAGGDLFGAVVTGRRFSIPKAIYRWL